MYSIYCHIFPNEKRYIGVTKTSLERRWNNGNSYATCPLMCRAINKYGWDNVKHTVLDTAESKEAAEEKERYYIARYKSNDPVFGYNVLAGGDVAMGDVPKEVREKIGESLRGRKLTDEHKEKIQNGVKKKFSRAESNGHYGLKASDEIKAKMSASQKESWNEERAKAASERLRKRMAEGEFREKVLTNLASIPKRKPGEWNMPEEAKEKLSKHFKGKWIGENSPCSKPVLQYTKNGEFVRKWANAGEAERAGIALRANISKCCRKAPHVKTVGGYVWRFEEE